MTRIKALMTQHAHNKIVFQFFLYRNETTWKSLLNLKFAKNKKQTIEFDIKKLLFFNSIKANWPGKVCFFFFYNFRISRARKVSVFDLIYLFFFVATGSGSKT